MQNKNILYLLSFYTVLATSDKFFFSSTGTLYKICILDPLKFQWNPINNVVKKLYSSLNILEGRNVFSAPLNSYHIGYSSFKNLQDRNVYIVLLESYKIGKFYVFLLESYKKCFLGSSTRILHDRNVFHCCIIIL